MAIPKNISIPTNNLAKIGEKDQLEIPISISVSSNGSIGYSFVKAENKKVAATMTRNM